MAKSKFPFFTKGTLKRLNKKFASKTVTNICTSEDEFEPKFRNLNYAAVVKTNKKANEAFGSLEDEDLKIFQVDSKKVSDSWLLQKKEVVQKLLPKILQVYAISDGVNTINDIMSDSLKLNNDGLDTNEVNTTLNKLLKLEILSVLVNTILVDTPKEYKDAVISRAIAREYPSKDGPTIPTNNDNNIRALRKVIERKTNEILKDDEDTSPFPNVPKSGQVAPNSFNQTITKPLGVIRKESRGR